MAEGEFALVRDHLAKAADGPTDPVRWGSAMSDLDFHIACADMAAQARDRAGLETYAQPAAAESLRLGHRLYQGISQRALGIQKQLAGDVIGALEHLHQAGAVFEELGTRWQLGQTRVAIAETLLGADRQSEARDAYRQALAAFESLDAGPAATQVNEALARIGA